MTEANFDVRISYKNKNMETVIDKIYPVDDYMNMIKMNLMKTIMDIEDIFYKQQGNKVKEEWDANAINDFNKIRHKILDQANAVGRIYTTLNMNGIPINQIDTNNKNNE